MTADSPSSFPTSLIDLRGVKGKNCQDGTPCRGGNMGCARIEGNGAVGPSHKRHQSGKGRFSQGIDDAFGMLHPVFDGVHLRTMRFNARYDDGRIIARDEPVSKGGELFSPPVLCLCGRLHAKKHLWSLGRTSSKQGISGGKIL